MKRCSLASNHNTNQAIQIIIPADKEGKEEWMTKPEDLEEEPEVVVEFCCNSLALT